MDQKSTEHQQARNLYFQTELTQSQIADLLNINRKTLYGWIKEGCWKRAKYAAKHVPCILAEQYLGQLGELNKAIAQRKERPYPTKEEADIMRKVSTTYKTVKGNRKIISDNIELFEYFTQELRLENFQVAKDFMPYMDKYIKMCIKQGQGLDTPWKSYLQDKASDRDYEQWLSEQPNPGSLENIINSFPPGYFTADYDPDAPIQKNANSDFDSPPSSKEEYPPMVGEVVAQLNSEPLETPPSPPTHDLVENEALPPSPPVERAGVRSGVTNGVTTTPENELNPLITTTGMQNDNTDLSTKENEKWGVPTPVGKGDSGDTKQGIKITVGSKFITIPTDELPDDIIKSLKALNKIVRDKEKDSSLNGNNENNKAA